MEVKAEVSILNQPDSQVLINIINTCAKVCTSKESGVEIFESNEKSLEGKDCTFRHGEEVSGECLGKDGSLCDTTDCPQAKSTEKALQKQLKTIIGCIKSGHSSVLEHVHFVFAISGVSRACTHQLVRHRHIAISHQSQRYVEEKKQFEYITPDTLRCDKKIITDWGQLDYHDFMKLSSQMYLGLIGKENKPEDARFVLPNAAASNINVTFNLSSLIHFFNERLCFHAQWEIKEVAHKMRDLVLKEHSWLEPFLAPKCKKLGHCNEMKPCGITIKKSEVDEAVRLYESKKEM